MNKIYLDSFCSADKLKNQVLVNFYEKVATYDAVADQKFLCRSFRARKKILRKESLKIPQFRPFKLNFWGSLDHIPN